MKKIVVVVVIVLAGVFGFAPNYVGGKAEEQYDGIVEQLRLSGFQVATHQYQRGWLDAQANTELVLPLPQAPDTDGGDSKIPKELRFTLVSTINHGPLVPSHGTALAEIDTSSRQIWCLDIDSAAT